MQFHGISDNTASADGADLSMKDYTLIVPCVSVGNVGQLSCDLLISSLELLKIGHLHTECVLPIVGSSPFDSNKGSSVTLSLELYHDKRKQIAVLQQRAPTVPGKLSQFAGELITWISNHNFARVIMLTSCHAYERLDNEIRNSKVLFIAEENLHQQLINQGMTPLNQRKDEFGSTSYFMPGSGIAKPFHDLCMADTPKFAYALFMIFCSEGDNVPEAVELLNAVNQWQKFIEINNRNKLNWKVPASWKQMFGSGAPRSIF